MADEADEDALHDPTGWPGASLHKATFWVKAATKALVNLPPKPTGDTPTPFNFGKVRKELPLLKEALQAFEEKLSARPEVSEGG
jgi:hypothetical protein